MEPLPLLLLGLLVIFTGTGWQVVVLPLFFLAFRLLMVLVLGRAHGGLGDGGGRPSLWAAPASTVRS